MHCARQRPFAGLAGIVTISGRRTANGSLSTISRAHQTAWPRPSGTCRSGKISPERAELLEFAASLQRFLKFISDVEVIFDHRLVAPGHEDEMLDPGLARFLDDMLEHRTIDKRQHFFRDGFCCREESCAEPGDRENGFANAFCHCLSRARPPHWREHIAPETANRGRAASSLKHSAPITRMRRFGVGRERAG